MKGSDAIEVLVRVEHLSEHGDHSLLNILVSVESLQDEQMLTAGLTDLTDVIIQ